MFNNKFLLGPNFQQKISLGTPKSVVTEVPEQSEPVVEITKPNEIAEITEKESKSSKK